MPISLDISEKESKLFSSALQKESRKSVIPQSVEQIIELNFETVQTVVKNRGYKALKKILKETLDIDVEISTLKAYVSRIRKKNKETESGSKPESKK